MLNFKHKRGCHFHKGHKTKSCYYLCMTLDTFVTLWAITKLYITATDPKRNYLLSIKEVDRIFVLSVFFFKTPTISEE